MEYRTLGKTDIEVSTICLGTMTWGQQNTTEEAFEQMDYALQRGVNFFDTAELYSIPPKAETYTKTETIIGKWLAARGNREKVIIASKIAGPGLAWIRNGSQFTATHLNKALEASLMRLQTDYIDLYQLHWPERNTNFFGKLGFTPSKQEAFTPIHDVVATLDGFIQQGKIRAWGISNETPWGVMQYLKHSNPAHQVASIQNPYSLLNRTFEVGLAEMAYREKVGLLAYSPLAFGVLTGKYLNNQRPPNARLTLFPSYGRYTNPRSEKAAQAYVNLAKEVNLSPAQLALSFVNSRPFLTSNIIGATSMAQLKENIDSLDVKMTQDILNRINEIHAENPNPAP